MYLRVGYQITGRTFGTPPLMHAETATKAAKPNKQPAGRHQRKYGQRAEEHGERGGGGGIHSSCVIVVVPLETGDGGGGGGVGGVHHATGAQLRRQWEGGGDASRALWQISSFRTVGHTCRFLTRSTVSLFLFPSTSHNSRTFTSEMTFPAHRTVGRLHQRRPSATNRRSPQTAQQPLAPPLPAPKGNVWLFGKHSVALPAPVVRWHLVLRYLSRRRSL